LRAVPRPPAGGDAQGADGLWQDAVRGAHGMAARPPARDRGLPRRPPGKRPHGPPPRPRPRGGLAGRPADARPPPPRAPRHRRGETVCQDGPLPLDARLGAICYLDEVVEARQDTVVVIHPLTDHRRRLPVEKTGELVEAAEGFQLVVSYNPGYQHVLKDLKPSTRQRFVALDFGFPPPEREVAIVQHESGVDRATAHQLVGLGSRLRHLRDRGLAELPSTRLLVATARLIAGGIAPTTACRVGLVAPLSDDADLVGAMHDLVDLTMA